MATKGDELFLSYGVMGQVYSSVNFPGVLRADGRDLLQRFHATSRSRPSAAEYPSGDDSASRA